MGDWTNLILDPKHAVYFFSFYFILFFSIAIYAPYTFFHLKDAV